MNYFLIRNVNDDRHAFIVDFMRKLGHVDHRDWHSLHFETSEYTMVMAKFVSSYAESELERYGAIVWPHLADHDSRIQSVHHVDKLPSHLGIKTGDSAYTAAKKVAKVFPIFHPRMF